MKTSDEVAFELTAALYDIGNGRGHDKFDAVRCVFPYHDPRFDLLEWLERSMPEIMQRREEAAGPSDFTRQFRLLLKSVAEGACPDFKTVDDVLRYIRSKADGSYRHGEGTGF